MMAEVPDVIRVEYEQCSIPLATSVDQYLRNLAVSGVSGLWIPDDPTDAHQIYLDAQRMLGQENRHYAPTASPLSGSGYYGQSCARTIPDTPYDEWCAGVEALLAECAAVDTEIARVRDDRR